MGKAESRAQEFENKMQQIYKYIHIYAYVYVLLRNILSPD
jgi:hypothetical protein